METSPLPVKGCKFWPMRGTFGHWAVRVLSRATPTVTQPVRNCPPWLKEESGLILLDGIHLSVIKMLSCIRRIQGGVRAVYGSKYLNEIGSIPCLKSPSIDALHILGGIHLINKTYSVLGQHGFLLKLTWIPSYIQIKSIQWWDGVGLILRRNPVNAVSHSTWWGEGGGVSPQVESVNVWYTNYF